MTHTYYLDLSPTACVTVLGVCAALCYLANLSLRIARTKARTDG